VEGGEGGQREGGGVQGGETAVSQVKGLQGGWQGGWREIVEVRIVGEVKADEERKVDQGSHLHLLQLGAVGDVERGEGGGGGGGGESVREKGDDWVAREAETE